MLIRMTGNQYCMILILGYHTPKYPSISCDILVRRRPERAVLYIIENHKNASRPQWCFFQSFFHFKNLENPTKTLLVSPKKGGTICRLALRRWRAVGPEGSPKSQRDVVDLYTYRGASPHKNHHFRWMKYGMYLEVSISCRYQCRIYIDALYVASY